MNTERLLKEIERRLAGLPDGERTEVLEAVRDEVTREKRRSPPPSTVEVERERRAYAETFREVLEAINRQATLEQTIDEVLKQLSRIVTFDSASVALLDPDGSFRIIASRGFPDPGQIRGATFHDDLSEILRIGRAPVTVPDVSMDDRFGKIEGTQDIRSWAGVPLLVEGDIIGILSLDRHSVSPFEEGDLHRAKAVAFSAAAAIRKAQLLEKLRRYATLLENVVRVDEAVLAARPPTQVAHVIVEGAVRIGTYAGGMLVLEEGGVRRVVAASGEAPLAEGADAPPGLAVTEARRLSAEEVVRLGGLGDRELYLVPLSTAEAHLGTLALVDPDGVSADDRLLESYASRAAAAYVHARERGAR